MLHDDAGPRLGVAERRRMRRRELLDLDYSGIGRCDHSKTRPGALRVRICFFAARSFRHAFRGRFAPHVGETPCRRFAAQLRYDAAMDWTRRKWVGLGVIVAICYVPSVLGALFMPDAWYAGLRKPSFNPPGWVFGPVWTVLYLLMGVAAWLVWLRRGRTALGLFAGQLTLNAVWTPLFFGAHAPLAALVDLALLWVLLLATGVGFFRIRPVAGWLLMPYLAWVSFAAALNLQIVRLN